MIRPLNVERIRSRSMPVPKTSTTSGASAAIRSISPGSLHAPSATARTLSEPRTAAWSGK
ncbi:hypothetical protein D3C83_38450 [compost metagenome]